MNDTDAQKSGRIHVVADVAVRIRSIRRSDGRIDDFNPSKIERSVQSAFATAGLTPTDESRRIRQIAERIIERLGKEFDASRPPSTCDVREMVKETLREFSLPLVARAYFKYSRQPKSTNALPMPAPLPSNASASATSIPDQSPASVKTPAFESPKAMPDAYAARRRRLSDERRSITHKFEIGVHQGYVTVGLYEDGTPGEIFLRMGRESGAISAIVDAFAMSVSLGLQYGVPLKTLVSKFAHMRFEPSGPTKNPNIPVASSIVDYIFRWLSLKFLTSEERHALGVHGEPGMTEGLGMMLESKNERQTSIV